MSLSATAGILVAEAAPTAQDIARIVRAEGLQVVATVTDPAQLALQIARTRPALAIIDVAFGGVDGIELLSAMPTSHRPRALYLSVDTDGETVDRVLRADGVGLLAKPFTDRQLAASVRLGLGRTIETRSAVRTLAQIAELVRDFRAPAPAPRALDPAIELPHELELTAREREVVLAVTRHLRIARVARVLHISPHTVRNHLRSIYSKLDVHSVDELLDRLPRSITAAGHDARMVVRATRSS